MPAPARPRPRNRPRGGRAHPAIRVRGLTKHYPSVTALDGIDLDVHSGEIVALLGPNGAGKTTTMEILEGHRRPDSGEVRVLGVDPRHATPAWRNRIGIVLQGAADFGTLTVRQVVDLFGVYYADPMPVEEALGLAELMEEADHRLNTLSGGKRRRLEIALGIIGRPQLLFLDEPTTGFAPEVRRRFWSLIRTLRDQGTTILLTTHHLDEAEHLADRVAVINKGRMVAVDTPARLGGRRTSAAEVRWRAPDGPRTVRTHTPTALVRKLTTEFRGEVPELTVTRLTLEDIYLDMIGQRA
ncbi:MULTISPECIES: ABC transporter ATP-binding protein [unclassified Streptomyces]|uniref:ABC transporter ATP-binding protein n=1 Tax=unclassified Streptomyces TaxID=2593676 RepID=UPI000367AACE|nr:MULTISPECIES: ABC transporter ATP-binding protein [unclassified Streptomyces]MYT28228.1 ATP-binding cassette domain-containing protein [Streptomyces sp. SID8354]